MMNLGFMMDTGNQIANFTGRNPICSLDILGCFEMDG
jgi:hypothetical protein